MPDLFNIDRNELSRSGDPSTSKLAAEELDIGRMSKLALDTLTAHPGSTSNELDLVAGLPMGSVRKRLTDLRKFGFAVTGDPRKCKITGKLCQTWWLGTTPSELIHSAQFEDLPGWKEFWEAYPRKVAKAAAQRAWKRLRPGPDLVQEIMASLERHKEVWDNPRYIPHPATWINGKRWEDDILPKTVQGLKEQLEKLRNGSSF